MAAYEMYNYPPVVPLWGLAFRRHIELIVIASRAYTPAREATDIDEESGKNIQRIIGRWSEGSRRFHL